MASGYWVLIIIFLLFFLISGIFMFCYCYGDHGGRFFGSNENIAAVVYTKVPLPKKKCRCSNKFKGICRDCEGPEFVDDGAEGRIIDFSSFGGDEGFDKNADKVDPIRGFLGNGGPAAGHVHSDGSGHQQQDSQYGGGDQSSSLGYGGYDSNSY